MEVTYKARGDRDGWQNIKGRMEMMWREGREEVEGYGLGWGGRGCRR
jgi:hypothetical protein